MDFIADRSKLAGVEGAGSQRGVGELAAAHGLAPMCDEPGFTSAINSMIAQSAPRLFAVVQVFGERFDARIAAWGMAWEDGTEVFGLDGHPRMSVSSPERARGLLSLEAEDVVAHLVWLPENTQAPGLWAPPIACR
ncbi:MAG: hypothetical protein M3443_10055 [Actinomycetota bacterium]|nr:hypothetical protein [Actinomycetota bacterium]